MYIYMSLGYKGVYLYVIVFYCCEVGDVINCFHFVYIALFLLSSTASLCEHLDICTYRVF